MEELVFWGQLGGWDVGPLTNKPTMCLMLIVPCLLFARHQEVTHGTTDAKVQLIKPH